MKKLIGVFLIISSLVVMADHSPYKFLEKRLEHTYFMVTDGAVSLEVDDFSIYNTSTGALQVFLEIEGSKEAWLRLNKGSFNEFLRRVANDIRATLAITSKVTIVSILETHGGDEIVDQQDL